VCDLFRAGDIRPETCPILEELDKIEGLYGLIKFREGYVVVPFVCRRCGRCCRQWSPQICGELIPVVSGHLGLSEEEVRKRHEVHYKSKWGPAPLDCLFLSEDSRCTISRLRPRGCRLYPLKTDAGACGVDCPGHEEFLRVVESLCRRRIYAEMCIVTRLGRHRGRHPGREAWARLWRKFLFARPCKDLIRTFVELNGVPQCVLDNRPRV